MRRDRRACACSEGLLVEAPGVEVPTDLAVPLALIVNELVTNAVKHGRLPCRVGLRTEADGQLRLAVRDAGPGPASSTIPQGLGSRIVDAFARQLGARLESKLGTAATRSRLPYRWPQSCDE